MVTERQPAAEATDIEIVDTTSPEVDARIREARGEAPPQEAPPSPSPEPAPAPTPTPAPAAADVKPAEQPKPEAPPKRTYSEDEWSKMRRAAQERENALQRRMAEIEARLGEQQLEAQVEGYRRQLVADYQAQNIDPAQAESLAGRFAPERRTYLQTNLRLQQAEYERQHIAAESEEAAKRAVAERVIQENQLDPSDIDVVLTATTPDAMLKLGKRLGAAAGITREAQKKKVDSVPPVQTVTGKSDATPVSGDDEVLARIDAGTESEADWRAYEKIRARRS